MITPKKTVFSAFTDYTTYVYVITLTILAIISQVDIKTAETICGLLAVFIDLLPKFGIQFYDGFLSGPWPPIVYHVLIGISIWFVIICGIAITIRFIATFDFLRQPTQFAKYFLIQNNWQPGSAELIR